MPPSADVLEQRDVPLVLAGVVDVVARRVAERAAAGRVKAAGLNQKFWSRPCPAENCRSRRPFGSPTRFQGCAMLSPMPAMSAASRHPERRAGAHEGGARDLPAAEHLAESRPGLLSIERQIVDVVEVEHVAAIEARVAPEARSRRRC